ncbi:hypothetical protein HOY82DRAFT_625038 [Tuber indicum]|nr:hypothetical protein HOY82DRAFT_625038 [Tuber indicum]
MTCATVVTLSPLSFLLTLSCSFSTVLLWHTLLHSSPPIRASLALCFSGPPPFPDLFSPTQVPVYLAPTHSPTDPISHRIQFSYPLAPVHSAPSRSGSGTPLFSYTPALTYPVPRVFCAPHGPAITTDKLPSENGFAVQDIVHWGPERLLSYIQVKLSELSRPLDVGDAQRFLDARIDGSVFFAGAGDSAFFKKASLSFGASVKLAGPSGKIVGRDSNSEQTGLTWSSNNTFEALPLKCKTDPDLWELSNRASQRRIQIYHKCRSLSSEELSDPAFMTKLPFPFVFRTLPKRFKFEAEQGEYNWVYMGCEKFAELLHRLEEVRESPQNSGFWLYGTRGYGKSHLLAALACIFDCERGENRLHSRLSYLESVKKVILIFDQMNAPAYSMGDSPELKEKKRQLEVWLLRWKRNSNIVVDGNNTRGGYTKEQVEDQTGCIPLFLNSCLIYGEIDLGVDILKKATPTDVDPELIDYRYSKIWCPTPATRYEVGAYACGIARDAAVKQLWKYGKNKFGDADFLKALDEYINNEAVTGFFIEENLLSTISLSGLEIGRNISKPMDTQMFREYPTFAITEQPILYCPMQFNFRAIDGIVSCSPYRLLSQSRIRIQNVNSSKIGVNGFKILRTITLK